MSKIYDVIIVGAGPAGLTAGLYAARAKMETMILEKERTGGQIVTTDEVANYPGSVKDATGPTLIARMVEQAKEFGAEILKGEIVEIDFHGDIKKLKTKDEEFKARTVIIATGASPRKLGCPGEDKFTGKGVSYCATCDGDFFTDLEVFAIGGGDTAVEEALFLTKFARKVTIVHRRDEFRAAKSIVEKAMKHPKIEIMWDSVVEEVKGEGILQSAVFKNTKTGELTEYKANEEDMTFGMFVFVGYLPQTSLFQGIIDMDKSGYIISDESMKTNIEGVYCAGDVRQKTLRQVVTAVSDGAVAAVNCEKYIEEKFE